MSPLLLPRSIEEDVRLELESHLALRVEELVRSGWGEAEARREADCLMGDLGTVQRRCEAEAEIHRRRQWARRWVRGAVGSWVRGARRLVRDGAFTARSVMVLGLAVAFSALLQAEPVTTGPGAARMSGGDSAFGILQEGAALLLLMAVVHLTVASLGRGDGRRSERILRRALGAPRRIRVSEILVEAALLGLLGGTAALGFAAAVVGLGPVGDAGVVGPPSCSYLWAWVRAVAAPAWVISLAVAGLGAVGPAWRRAKENLRGPPRRASAAPVGPSGVRRALVVGQAVLACLLTARSAAVLAQGSTGLAPLPALAPFFLPGGAVLLLGLTLAAARRHRRPSAT